MLSPISDQTVNEGSLLSFTATATDPDTGQALTYSLDPGAPAGASINPSTGVFAWTPSDGPASAMITVRVTDNGSPQGTDAKSFTVTVNNVAPTVSAGGLATIGTGATLTRAGSFSDPGADTWTATVDYGDGSGSKPLNLNGKSFTLSHPYMTAGTFTAIVTVTDKDGGVGSANIPVTVAAPAGVMSVVINDGSAQRSMVDSMTVTFNEVVTLDGGAFTMTSSTGTSVAVNVSSSFVNGRTVAVLTFSGSGIIGGSLADGRYTLTIHADKVHDTMGQALDGDGDGFAGGNKMDSFFRLYGDANGNGKVDDSDYALFRSAYNTKAGQPGYLWYFDYDNNGAINTLDRQQFLNRRGKSI